MELTPSQMRSLIRDIRKDGGEYGCWEWTGAMTNWGRGVASGAPAHRVVYAWLIGPIPEGLELDHLCRNRVCVNPHHLEPVTGAENQRRAREFGPREFISYCRKGHPLTRENAWMWSNGYAIRPVCRQCYRMRESVRAKKAA